MRSVVVLPAPLGPSRPVISPSCAVKPTPRTACTGPALALKLLCRLSTSIISGLPAVVAGERRRGAQASEALGVERGGVGGFEELGEQLRHAAGADHVVALAFEHQLAAVGPVLDDGIAVGRRRDRVELAAHR